jgi:AraC-like DNA-binding protein
MPIHPHIYKKIVAAKVYMDSCFCESIDLDHLSREACLSRYHFHRLFTRIYRTTPHQYLTRKRIERARLLLAEKDLTISQICNDVGFESFGSFSVLFKRESGLAPQFYRERAWRRRQEAAVQPRAFIPHCFIDRMRLEDGKE